MTASVLLLDVMGTLVYDPFFIEVPAFFQMSLKDLIKDKHPTAWPEFERDELTESEFCRKFFGDGRAVDGLKMRDCMRDAYRFLDGIESLLCRLKANEVPMYALSNYPHWYTLIEDKLRLSRFLEWRFVSCMTGVRKPDLQAYLGPAESLGLSPKDCVFVDDREINCKAAASIGMRTILYRNTPDFERELVKFGLLEKEQ